jgi:hypothetical protein
MKEDKKITIPTKWEEIPLGKWLLIQTDLDAYKDEPEAQLNIMIHHFTGLSYETIMDLSKESYDKIVTTIESFQPAEGLGLQRFVEIGGVEYGFEPNLSSMAYGAYVDISSLEAVSIDKNWGKIMDILYRPVTKKYKDMYELKPYGGNPDGDKWLDVGMDVHWGCLFFFLHTSLDLSRVIPSYLKEVVIPRSTKSTLAKNGKAIREFTNSLKEELKGLMK